MNHTAKLFLPMVVIIVLTFLSCDEHYNTEYITDTLYSTITDTVYINPNIPENPERRIYCLGGFVDPTQNPILPGGSPCCFEIIDVYAVIDSITPYNHISHKVFFSVFRKSDYKRISEMDNSYNQNYQRYKIDANCVSSKRFSVGDTLSGFLRMLVSGTCSPTPGLTIFDVNECFSIYGD
jgi:hypothetical protein